MDRSYVVMLKQGNVWIRVYTGSYDQCQWWSGTQRYPTRVELNI